MRTTRMTDAVRGVMAALAATGAAAADAHVELRSPLDGARLVGTLTVPAGDAPHAAALIVNATGFVQGLWKR